MLAKLTRRRGLITPSLTKDLVAHVILIVAALIALFPGLWILSTSFKTRADVFTMEINFIPPHFTWENYYYLFTTQNRIFLRWFLNSVIVALLTTIIGVFVAASAAYALSRFNFPGKSPLKYSFLVVQMFPGIIVVVPLFMVLQRIGVLNKYPGLVLSYLTFVLPFSVWMLKGFFDTIPREVEEAALVDGASTFDTFRRIMLPLSLPGLAVTAFFAFASAWNEFMFALTFMSSQDMYTLPVGLKALAVYQWSTDWHYMAAGAVIIALPVMVFFFQAQRYLVSGLTIGGIVE